jgi:hypothetical protein
MTRASKLLKYQSTLQSQFEKAPLNLDKFKQTSKSATASTPGKVPTDQHGVIPVGGREPNRIAFGTPNPGDAANKARGAASTVKDVTGAPDAATATSKAGNALQNVGVSPGAATAIGAGAALVGAKVLLNRRKKRKQLQKAQVGLASSGGTGIT